MLCSHDGAAFGLVLAKGGGEEIRLVGEVQQSFGEAADWAGFVGRLQFIHAGQSGGTKHTVDALF